MKLILTICLFSFSLFYPLSLLAQNPKWFTLADGKKVKALAEEGNSIWAGTSAGLVRIEKATGTTTFYNKTNKGALLDQINCIAIDAQGNKWIGTQNIGLVKFDGTNITLYNDENTTMHTNTIRKIVIDNSNIKWILADGVLIKLNGTVFTNYAYDIQSLGNTSNDLAIDLNDNKWIATETGVGKFNGTSWTYYQSNASTFHTENANTIEVDVNGNVWVGTLQNPNVSGGLSKFDGTSWTRFTTNNINLNMLSDIFKDANGTMWVAGGGIFSYYNGTTFVSGSNVPPITSLLIDAQGTIWSGSIKGVTKTKGTNQTQIYTSASAIDNGNDSYSDNVFTKVVFDKDADPVMAFKNTEADGGYLYYLKNGQLIKYTSLNSMLNGRAIYDMVKDNSGNLWLGAGPAPIKFDGNYWTNFYSQLNNSNISGYTNILSMAIDQNGNVWIGTDGISGIGRYNGTSWTWYKSTTSGLRSDAVNSIVVDNNNNVWAATDLGLCKFDGSSWTGYGAYSPYSEIAVDQTNAIWLTSIQGLHRFDGNFTRYHTGNSSIPSNNLSAIKIDASGNKWVGINNIGLAKFNGTTWTSYTPTNSGLPNFNINDINIDLKNNLFISTGSGLCIYNENTIDLTLPVTNEPKPLEFLSPKSGQTITSCTPVDITWLPYGKSASDKINLFYTTDGGANWISIANNISYINNIVYSASYTWYPPAINSMRCMIKAVDANNPALEFKSQTFFKIIYAGGKSITMNSPSTSEVLNTGQQKNITWTNNGTISKISILYSYNNGSWISIVSNINNTGAYTWNVPGVAGNYSIKVQDFSQSCIFSQTDVLVNAVPFFNLTYPNLLGSTLGSSTVSAITWSFGNISSGFVNLELSTDEGLSWTNIATKATNNGNYNWTVPAITSSKCLIRVSEWNNTSVNDISDAVFSIVQVSITLITPQPAGNVNACGNYNITWQANGVSGSLFRLYSSIDDGLTWTQITIASGFSYSWYVSSTVSTATYRLKIASYSDASVFVVSEPFTVVNQGPFTITYPNGGQNLQVGSACDITWTKTGTQNYVNLFYSLDGETNWILIGLVSNDALHYLWTVPSKISSSARIKMVDYSSCLMEISDAPFRISSPRVWPGDADNNGKVTFEDLLPLGLYNTNTGVARDSVSNLWMAHGSNAWNILQANGNDLKYADCNGDGTINATDINAITLNFGRVQSSSGLRETSSTGSYDMFFVFPEQSYLPGQTVNGELWIARSSNPFPDFYGASFDISFNQTAIEPNTFHIDYSNNWLGNYTWNLSKYFETQGIVYGAIVGNNQIGQTGYGKIANLSFVINSMYNGSTLSLEVVCQKAINASGIVQDLQTSSSTLLTSTLTPIEELNDDLLRLFPNPAKESFIIQLPTIAEPANLKIELINTIGDIYQPIHVMCQGNQVEVKTDASLKGLYSVRICNGRQIYMKSISLY